MKFLYCYQPYLLRNVRKSVDFRIIQIIFILILKHEIIIERKRETVLNVNFNFDLQKKKKILNKLVRELIKILILRTFF